MESSRHMQEMIFEGDIRGEKVLLLLDRGSSHPRIIRSTRLKVFNHAFTVELGGNLTAEAQELCLRVLIQLPS